VYTYLRGKQWDPTDNWLAKRWVDTTAMQETSLRETSSVRYSDYTFYWSGNRQRGGFVVNNT